MGMDINIHDQWACETQGPIQDRTREHLGTSDRGIIAYRRMLLDAIAAVQKGERPLMCLEAAAARTLHGPECGSFQANESQVFFARGRGGSKVEINMLDTAIAWSRAV
jgi:hypothetical protein